MKADLPTQVPAGDRIFLDHVGWFVSDMEAVASRFMKLGLPMTPLTVHMNEHADGSRVPSGTANRCSMIRRGYLEVLVTVEGVDTPLTRQMNSGLSRYEGLHLVAFSVEDTTQAAERLQTAGFAPVPPVALRRPMPLDDGGEEVAEFSVLRTASDAMAEGRVQILSHGTPETVWQPSVTADENGFELLTGLLICSGDPKEAAERYARFTDRQATPQGDGFQIRLDRGEIVIQPEEACRAILPGLRIPGLPFMAGVAIRTADLKTSRSFFRKQGVPLLVDEPERVVVDQDAGAGSVFYVHEDGVDPFVVP